MASLNKIMMIGRLTRDPQMSYLPSQTPVVEFGMATNRKWNDKTTGEQREEVCFVDCQCYGKQAETLHKYVHKGDQLYIEGRLQLDTWDDKQSGAKRSKLRIFVQSFQFLNNSGGNDEQLPYGATAVPQAPAAQTGPPAIPDDEITF